MIEKKFLIALSEKRHEWERSALENPTEKTEYGFGRACGFWQGLLFAEQLLNEILEDAANRDSYR